MQLNWQEFKSRAAGDGLWVTLLYRWVAARLAFGFYKFGVGPNVVTILSTLVSALAMMLLVVGYPMTITGAVVVGLLMALGYAFDCADGQLARATGQSSKLGEWLDHTTDSVTSYTVHFSVAWILLQRGDAGAYSFGVAFLALVLNLGGSGVFFFAWQMKTKIAGDNAIQNSISEAKRRKIGLMKLPLQITDYGLFVCVFFLSHSPIFFEWSYLVYGMVTFFIFTLYIIYSGYALNMIDRVKLN